MRKLFSPKHKDDSGQRGQEPALTMPDGSPLPPLPDLVVLDKKFSEMLDALAIPAAARPKMLQQAPQQKWLMLQMQDLRKKAKPQDAKAANYVTRLAALGGVVFDSLPEEENAEACEFMDSLRVELSGCSLDWLRQFFDAGGLKELTHVMLWNTHNPRVMYSCVKAIKSAAKVTDGLAEVVRTPNLVAALTGAFGVGPKFMPAMKLRSAVLQLLTVIVTQSTAGHEKVLRAWEDFRDANGEPLRYTTLLDAMEGMEPPEEDEDNKDGDNKDDENFGALEKGVAGSAGGAGATPVSTPAAGGGRRMSSGSTPGTGGRDAQESTSSATAGRRFSQTKHGGGPYDASLAGTPTVNTGADSSSITQYKEKFDIVAVWQLRSGALLFINELINLPQLHRRATIREDFVFAGILDLIEDLRTEAEETLSQLGDPAFSALGEALSLFVASSDIFFRMATEDEREAVELGFGLALGDPKAVFEGVLAHAGRAGQLESLLCMLHHLYVLPAVRPGHGYFASNMWRRAERRLRPLTLGPLLEDNNNDPAAAAAPMSPTAAQAQARSPAVAAAATLRQMNSPHNEHQHSFEDISLMIHQAEELAALRSKLDPAYAAAEGRTQPQPEPKVDAAASAAAVAAAEARVAELQATVETLRRELASRDKALAEAQAAAAAAAAAVSSSVTTTASVTAAAGDAVSATPSPSEARPRLPFTLPPRTGGGEGGGGAARPDMSAMLGARPSRPLGTAGSVGGGLGAMLMARGPMGGGGPRGPAAGAAAAGGETAESLLPKKAPPPHTAGLKMRGLFWNKLPDVSIGTSIWKDLSDQNALLEREEIEKLFRAAAPAAMPAAPDPSKAAASGPIMLFDAKRQQNAGIPLARVRLTPKEVRDAVLAMDANVLTQEKLTLLLQIVPTSEELAQLHEYDGDISRLGGVEQLFSAVREVPNYEARLNMLLQRHKFADVAGNLSQRLGVIGRAITAIRTSKAFRTVLEFVLAIGNFLNAESPARGGAYGVKIDVLTKLATVKGADTKSCHNLLEYLAMISISTIGKAAGISRVYAELATPLEEAKLESLEAALSEIKTLNDGLNKIKNLLGKAAASDAQVQGDHFQSVMSEFHASATKTYDNLNDMALATNYAFKELLQSFAEDPCDTTAFFTMLHTFVNSFHNAELAVQERLERERKTEARAAAKAAAQAAKAVITPGENAVDDIYQNIQASGTDAAAMVEQMQRRRIEKRVEVDPELFYVEDAPHLAYSSSLSASAGSGAGGGGGSSTGKTDRMAVGPRKSRTGTGAGTIKSGTLRAAIKAGSAGLQ